MFVSCAGCLFLSLLVFEKNGCLKVEKVSLFVRTCCLPLWLLLLDPNSLHSYPAYMPVLHRAMELWSHDPTVTSPLLKLLAGMVTNDAQRLQFSVSSANGVLLMREASQMLVTYGETNCTGWCEFLSTKAK